MIPQLRQYCFSEQLLIPVTKIHYAECSKRLEIGVYNYVFSECNWEISVIKYRFYWEIWFL